MKLIVAALLGLCDPCPAQGRPNVLFISIDDCRPEIGCYGADDVRTPHLDKFASTGVRFDRAYCQVPICGGSRASLMTGILPTPERFVTMERVDEVAPWAATLPETFKKAGYTTISNGKIFHDKDDTGARSWSMPAWRPEMSSMRSFDPATRERLSATKKRGLIYEAPEVDDHVYPDGAVAKKTINDLQHFKKEGGPFFLACGFVRPHLPFYAPKKYWDLYERNSIAIAPNRSRPKGAPPQLRGSREFTSYHLGDFKVNSEAWHRMMRHGYLASVSYVDQLAGSVLSELERLDLADDTIVVIWGDHGFHLGEHNFWGKHNTMQVATRVPLIVHVPGMKPGATSALVESSDIFPTLCQLAAIPVPETVQGKSFASLLDDPAEDFRESAYTRFRTADAITTKRFSYTSYAGGQAEMLYDLENDPGEDENVAGKPSYADTLKKMRTLLRARQTEAATLPKPKPRKAAAYDGDVPEATFVEVSYGPHERNVLDFWQAESDGPTPLVVVIHGGGWNAGSKERLNRFADAKALLDAGISVAAINYRLMKHASEVSPPVKAPLHDAARAVQFLRSKAGKWNIDTERIGAAGGSAGACSSLWLAYHDDLANPDSKDPVERQSTRLACAAVIGAQTTLDPKQMKEWTPNSRYGGHAFGKKDFAAFLAAREEILPWIAEYSPYAQASEDDPPVALFYSKAPEMGKVQKDPTHTANFGLGLQRRCQELGIGCELVYPGAKAVTHRTTTEYLIEVLGQGNSD